ncbi:MAG: hypothetical protein QOG27_791 [Verrucomicrobiota bacterium]
MNGNEPKIEIFAPFGAGYEWMKTVLFRPFDAGKWFVIAFAAFLSGAQGGGFNPGQLGRLAPGDWKYQKTTHGNVPTDWNFTPWIVGLAIAVVLFALVLAIVWMWISSRGRFIFTDCVVKNRAAIAEPWREYRREGNSFFVFSLFVGALALVLVVLTVVAIVLPLGGFSGARTLSGAASVALVVILIVFGLIWFALIVFWALVSHFMIPVMYRRRCAAKEAFRDVAKLIFGNPGPFVLFVLFMLVLAIAVAIVGSTVACMTCCIGALPYISTVLLLPAFVWLAAFRLLFLRQFGDQFDVWATVAVPEPTAAPPIANLPPSPPPPPPAL